MFLSGIKKDIALQHILSLTKSEKTISGSFLIRAKGKDRILIEVGDACKIIGDVHTYLISPEGLPKIFQLKKR